MSDYLKRFFYDFLYFRKSSITETEWFKNKKHDKDLVPAINDKAFDIIDSFDKYHSVSYDMQNVMDHGVDVIVKYDDKSGGENAKKYIGFQIKSYDDINTDGWLKTLKAQAQDAKTNFDLTDYYIMLCTFESEHLAKIRSASAAFAKDKETYIVGPRHAREFFRISTFSIGAFLKAKLSEEDVVFRKAFESVSDLNPHQAAILIELVVSSQLENKLEWTLEEIRGRSFVQSIYTSLPNLPEWFYSQEFDVEERDEFQKRLDNPDKLNIEEDLEILDSNFININPIDYTVNFSTDNAMAIAALSLDGYVRYGFTGEDLKSYLLETLHEEKLREAADVLSEGLPPAHDNY